MLDSATQSLIDSLSEVAQNKDYLGLKIGLSEFFNYENDKSSLGFTVLKIRIEQMEPVLGEIDKAIRKCKSMRNDITPKEELEVFFDSIDSTISLLETDLSNIKSIFQTFKSKK